MFRSNASVSPVWKSFDSLNMIATQALNMFAYCEGADAISWQHNFTVPTDIELTDGILRITGDSFQTENTFEIACQNTWGRFR